jgi:hypothetical protein
MSLIILLALAATGLAATAEYFSVVGLATTYAGSFNSVVALGCAIGFGKLVGVSFLYRFRQQLTLGFKSMLSVIIISMMLITSFGVFGFLTKANQSDMVGLKKTNVTQSLLQEEAARLNARKLQIDQQIAQLKADDVRGRVRLTQQFKDELKEINTRVPQIEKEKATLATTEITQQSDIGPLIYLAKSMGLDADVATTWFTLLLVVVLDPAAVVLTLCTNIAIAQRQRSKIKPPVPSQQDGEIAPVEGSIRFNAEHQSFELYKDGQWQWYKQHNDNHTVPQRTNEISEQSIAPDDHTPQVVPHEEAITQPDEQPEPLSAFPVLVDTLAHQLPDTQQELDFAAPIVEDDDQPTITVSDTQVVATMELDTSSTDSADSLLNEVAIAQGPQLVVDTTGIEQNGFGQPNRVAWDNFVDVANKMANAKNSRDPNEFKLHLAQLQAYIDELDARKELINDDESALRSRILAFIQRHQSV